jgi:hypothetical protein
MVNSQDKFGQLLAQDTPTVRESKLGSVVRLTAQLHGIPWCRGQRVKLASVCPISATIRVTACNRIVQKVRLRSSPTTKPGVAQRTPGSHANLHTNPEGVAHATVLNPVGVPGLFCVLPSRGALRDPGLCCETASRSVWHVGELNGPEFGV